MSMRSLRKWLLRSTSQRVDSHPGDGVLLLESSELRKAVGEKMQELTSEMRLAAAIDSAWIIERNAAGRDGVIEPNIFITCPTLRGTFKFSPEESERRILLAFPELDDKAVKASIRHLVDRVVSCLTEKSIPGDDPRPSFVHDWAADRESLFRL